LVKKKIVKPQYLSITKMIFQAPRYQEIIRRFEQGLDDSKPQRVKKQRLHDRSQQSGDGSIFVEEEPLFMASSILQMEA